MKDIKQLSVLVGLLLAACGSSSSDDLNSGGLEPPPGFLEQVDINCRAETDLALSADAPTVRALNSQSLLTYTLSDGGTAQCAVRHTDGSVIDIRVMGTG